MVSSSSKAVSVRLSVEGSEQVKAALTRLGEDGQAALAKLKFDTSTASGPRIFQGALDEARVAANDLTGSLGPLGNILGGVGGAYLAAGAAAGGFAELVKKSIEAAEGEEQAQRRITAVLQATGGASGQTAASIEEMATRISHSTLATKDDVMNAAASLATFRNVGPDAFERTIAAAQDMAAVFGGDLQGNVMKLGLALDDPIKGMNRLRRSGLDLSASQQEVIKTLQETGNLAGAQGALLDALSKKLGGAGAAQHEGLTGASHDAGVAWHEFLVELDQTAHFTGFAIGGLDLLAATLKKLHDTPWMLGDLDPTGLSSAAMLLAGGTKGSANVNATADGHPYKIKPSDTDAMLGPGRAAQERQDAVGQALDDAITNLTQEGSAVGARQRFINTKLEAIAKANEMTVVALQSQQPAKFNALTAAAGHDYDSEHADQTNKSARERAQKMEELGIKAQEEAKKEIDAASKAFLEQQKLYDDLVAVATAAHNQMKSSQDALLVHQLEGQTGYFSAVKQQNADWLTDSVAAINAEEVKQKASLDQKAEQYRKDGQVFTQYQNDLTLIEQSAANKRAAIESQASQKRIDLERAQQGALYPIIQKGSEDINLALKGIAADGLNGIENGFFDVIKGTESVSDAFKQMTALILEDMARLVLEKQVIAPLGGLLNGLIGGLGGGSGEANGGGDFIGTSGGSGGFLSSLFGSANGNAFDHGNVMAFANGGIVDGPTVMPMALMGEAGPEAIIPLARGSNGKLGISGGGSGDVHHHFSPTINISGGGSDDQIAALRAELNNQKRDFFTNSVQAYAQMKSRRIAR
ncbi:MAG TPA: hypothetical protein DEQ40_16390 [Oxalobacteraceae bacterium]|jgi:hypothetical protein|nr:hypothetical protein [Oxalobacteraceae bacterium]